MTDLKIPNLNMNSDKYIFKKKLSLRKKPKRRLFFEAVFMFFLGVFFVFVNYLIPNKNLLIQNLPNTLYESFNLIINFLSNIYEILLVLFIVGSPVIVIILFTGSFNRFFKTTKRKTRIINYK